jgi:hypothetical protein
VSFCVTFGFVAPAVSHNHYVDRSGTYNRVAGPGRDDVRKTCRGDAALPSFRNNRYIVHRHLSEMHIAARHVDAVGQCVQDSYRAVGLGGVGVLLKTSPGVMGSRPMMPKQRRRFPDALWLHSRSRRGVLRGHRGEAVRVAGLGSFDVAARPAREGRNPRTGEAIQIPASKAVRFHAGKAVKDALNPPTAKAAPGSDTPGRRRCAGSIAPARRSKSITPA